MACRNVAVVLAAVTLGAAGSSALSSALGPERGPAEPSRQRAFQVRPDPRAPTQLPAPSHASDGRDQAARDSHRPRGDQPHAETHRRDQPHRHVDGRHWVNPIPDHPHFGHVHPRPTYYGVPRVFYAPPVPYYNYAPPVAYYSATPRVAYHPRLLALQLGDYLPPEFRSQQFAVMDWEWRGLSPPPYGYQWMLLGPDLFALVAVSTGQIVSMVPTR